MTPLASAEISVAWGAGSGVEATVFRFAAPAKPKAWFIRSSTGGITTDPASTPMISATCCFHGVASTSWPVLRSCRLSLATTETASSTAVTNSAKAISA